MVAGCNTSICHLHCHCWSCCILGSSCDYCWYHCASKYHQVAARPNLDTEYSTGYTWRCFWLVTFHRAIYSDVVGASVHTYLCQVVWLCFTIAS
ncbi:hypothetical protein FOVG_19443 [Fusarium oxysporum f. sp. pisi HDV247]|uniref:Uncharacterized protein n=1 Tax=Fusarium oxysporum f. sp. pisi HDV247 TaxID=1080344 RepID=W9NE58_FUSOX|nr:hypothetical protein FOVG_19443 [Fusarium oxysporum f. sp. pisi HDV247]